MKINSIYDVMGNVDDKFVSEAATVKKKRPILLIAVAAAAALAMLIGSASVRNYNGTFAISGEEVYKEVFKMELQKYNLTIPEEYMPTKENGHCYPGKADIGVVELFEKFNAPLLITDKFSEVNPEAEGIVPHTYMEYEFNGEPFFKVRSDNVNFLYYLYSKTLDRNIFFDAYYLTDKAYYDSGVGFVYGEETYFEIIKLRNGSKCAVIASGVGDAVFSYNGVCYHIHLGNGEFDKEMTMQVLEDLEIL